MTAVSISLKKSFDKSVVVGGVNEIEESGEIEGNGTERGEIENVAGAGQGHENVIGRKRKDQEVGQGTEKGVSI